jgi:hypothetical protein
MDLGTLKDRAEVGDRLRRFSRLRRGRVWWCRQLGDALQGGGEQVILFGRVGIGALSPGRRGVCIVAGDLTGVMQG